MLKLIRWLLLGVSLPVYALVNPMVEQHDTSIHIKMNRTIHNNTDFIFELTPAQICRAKLTDNENDTIIYIHDFSQHKNLILHSSMSKTGIEHYFNQYLDTLLEQNIDKVQILDKQVDYIGSSVKPYTQQGVFSAIFYKNAELYAIYMRYYATSTSLFGIQQELKIEDSQNIGQALLLAADFIEQNLIRH